MSRGVQRTSEHHESARTRGEFGKSGKYIIGRVRDAVCSSLLSFVLMGEARAVRCVPRRAYYWTNQPQPRSMSADERTTSYNHSEQTRTPVLKSSAGLEIPLPW